MDSQLNAGGATGCRSVSWKSSLPLSYQHWGEPEEGRRAREGLSVEGGLETWRVLSTTHSPTHGKTGGGEGQMRANNDDRSPLHHINPECDSESRFRHKGEIHIRSIHTLFYYRDLTTCNQSEPHYLQVRHSCQQSSQSNCGVRAQTPSGLVTAWLSHKSFALMRDGLANT